MTIPIDVPLRTNDDGVMLIGESRVRLDSVIFAFQQGDSPEQIVDSFDSLRLADVYATIAYYLNHRETVEAYLQQQLADADALQKEIETYHPEIFTLRNRLLKKKHQK